MLTHFYDENIVCHVSTRNFVFLMPFPFQPLEAEGHVNDVGYESKEKMELFAIFPKRGIQRKISPVVSFACNTL